MVSGPSCFFETRKNTLFFKPEFFHQISSIFQNSPGIFKALVTSFKENPHVSVTAAEKLSPSRPGGPSCGQEAFWWATTSR